MVEEFAIVQPRMVVVMGEKALEALNELAIPLSRELEPDEGEIQQLTPTVDALFVPDIDVSLDTEDPSALLAAFRALGEWYDELPPY